jgi:hypothetical protein
MSITVPVEPFTKPYSTPMDPGAKTEKNHLCLISLRFGMFGLNGQNQPPKSRS